MKEVSDKEAENVLELAGPARYEYFVKWVADTETAWGLWRNGWALMGDSAGTQSIPVWPARRFAESARVDHFTDHVVREVPLHELRGLAHSLDAEHRRFAVFPNAEGRAPLVAPSDLLASIDAYIDEWL